PKVVGSNPAPATKRLKKAIRKNGLFCARLFCRQTPSFRFVRKRESFQIPKLRPPLRPLNVYLTIIEING
ncbi:hypothetical protein, partial [Pseudomonas sp. SDO55104_S430]